MDTKIAFITHPDCLLHDMGVNHPECPERLNVIERVLFASDLQPYLKMYFAPLVSLEQLHRVHDLKYLEHIFELAPQQGIIYLDPDTAMNPYTLIAARRAAGAAIKAVDIIMSEEAQAAFCSVRPPGHHAEHARAMGFCFFNNLAVGVAHALEYYQLKRIAIIDFDVHHGNGTQNIFQNDERVLLCSSFQHPFYPFSGVENMNEHIINLPLAAGTTGSDYRQLVQNLWFDKLNEHQPEMIFISAGFDAHQKDILANINLDSNDYFWITKNIKEIATHHCPNRIVSVLEGGYALSVLGECVVAHLRALL